MFGNKEAKKAEEIRTQIVERLEKQGSVLTNFSVKFDDGIITLAGDCDTAKTRDKAVLMAKGIEGVKDVKDSDLRVLQAAAPAPTPSAPAPAAPPQAPASHPLGAAAGSIGQAATRAAAPQPTTPPAPQAAPTAAAPAAQPPAQPQPATPAETIYTVQAGDNLSKIAKQFYGNANKYMVIFEANRDILKDPDKIAIGQKLRIPAQS